MCSGCRDFALIGVLGLPRLYRSRILTASPRADRSCRPPPPLYRMGDATILALIIVAVVICLYVSSRRLPAEPMRPKTFGEVLDYPRQRVYYPDWAEKMHKLPIAPSEAAVVERCMRDPLCSAVAYVTAGQDAHHRGATPDGGASHFWPYTIGVDSNAVYYRPTDAGSGPDLFVKSSLALTSVSDPAPELIKGGHRSPQKE